jgi:nucleoside-diphosphate-sugar epimerase
VRLVIHAAALAGVQPSWAALEEYWRTNVEATRLLRGACERAGGPRVVHISSISVYGDGEGLRESTPVRPLSPYGRTKLAAEQAWHGYPDVSIVRLSNVYGPGQRPDMAYATFLRAALNGRPIELRDGGAQLRTPTYVDDCVQGILAAAAHGARDRVYNIAGPEDVRLHAIPRLIGRLLGRPVSTTFARAAPGDPRTASVSSARATSELGFRARTALLEGLAAQLEAVQGIADRQRARAAATA